MSVFTNVEPLALVAALDIGSNALRFVAAEARPEDKFILTFKQRYPLRLGKDVFDDGHITETSMRELVECLIRFNEYCHSAGVCEYEAVATSAFREAQNALNVHERAQAESGIQFQIIDGTEEARLVFESVSQVFDYSRGRCVIVDIGGGSVEVIRVHEGCMVASESFPLGMVRLMMNRGRKSWMAIFEEVIGPVRQYLEEPFDYLIGTGGSFETLTMIYNDGVRGPVASLSLSEVEGVLKTLIDCPVDQRMERFGLEANRADVIEPALILITLLMGLHPGIQLVVPSVSLRQALLKRAWKRWKSGLPKK